MRIKTFLQKNKKHIILGLILGFVFAAGMFTPSASHAMFGISLSGIVTGIFKLIAYVFNFIAGIFFAVAAAFVSFALQLNMDVADPTLNTIADIGWRISRDIANLGFVLLTVIMAFMTIIRVQSYGAKKLLLNLVIAAVVVNFSFLIAGTLIDFSNTLTYFFVGRISPGGLLGTGAGPSGFTEVLANAFGPQKFMLEESDDPIPPDPSQEESGLVSFGVAVLSSIAGLFFIVFFTLLATIVLLMLAAMFIVRYVVLTFLLILAPLAWLFWVFPGLKSYNSQWWSSFWKYTFFAPAASFFVYLSLVAAENLGKSSYQSKISAAIGDGLPGALGKIAQNGVQIIVVAGLMIGAITVAQKMGIEGAKLAEKAKDGLMKGAKTYGKNRANAIGTKLAQNKFIGGTMSKLGLSGKNLKGTGEDIQKQRKEAQGKHLEYTDRLSQIKNNERMLKKNKELSDADRQKIIKENEELRAKGDEGKLSFKDRTKLFLKDNTKGKFKRGLGSIVENTGKGVDKQAMKKIEKGGWNKNLMKGAGEGAGLFKKPEKKDEQKTVAELQKDHGKLIKEKEDMLALRGPNGMPRFKDEDLKEINKKIEFSENKLVSAQGAKYRSMTKEDLEKEHTSLLEKQKKGGSKDEQNLNRRSLESVEKSINTKTREGTTTIGQIEDAQREAKKAADKDVLDGLDPTFHQDMVKSLEKQKERLEGKLGATAKAFNAIEEKIGKLNTERGEKLKEIKQANPKFSLEEIQNHDDVRAIDKKIELQRKQLSGWKETLTQGKYTEATIGKRVAAIEELKTELGDGEEAEKIRTELAEKQEKMKGDLEDMRNKQNKKGKK